MTTAAAKRPQLAHLTAQLDDLRQRGTFFKLRELDDQQAPVCTYDGKHVINLASNNYLGLCNHPKLEEAAIAATKKFGVGSGAVRTIAGTMRIHMELEEKIAAFKGVEACVVLPIRLHRQRRYRLFHPRQRRLHPLRRAPTTPASSTARACPAQRSKSSATKTPPTAEELTSAKSRTSPGHKLIITDGVFSMDGDIGPVDKLAALRGKIQRHHDGRRCPTPQASLGPQRPRLRSDHFHAVTDKVDVQVGTLSKAIGALGGYVCGSRDLIDYLYHRARPFLFSTSHPPSVAATCIAAFDILEDEPDRTSSAYGTTPTTSRSS